MKNPRVSWKPMTSILSRALILCLLTAGAACAGEAEDEAVIKASSDDIYSVRVTEVLEGEVRVSIENVLRGDEKKTGNRILVVWDADQSIKNRSFVIMVDGEKTVHPQIRYDTSEETSDMVSKQSWIYNLLK